MNRVEIRLIREALPIVRVNSPRDVYDLFGQEARSWPQERFIVLYLDVQSQVRFYEPVTVGILDASVVHPREVFRGAILANSACILLVHNHPSGDPAPSSADREITRQLVEAGRLLGIPVRDHVILGDGRYFSFLDAGLL